VEIRGAAEPRAAEGRFKRSHTLDQAGNVLEIACSVADQFRNSAMQSPTRTS